MPLYSSYVSRQCLLADLLLRVRDANLHSLFENLANERIRKFQLLRPYGSVNNDSVIFSVGFRRERTAEVDFEVRETYSDRKF